MKNVHTGKPSKTASIGYPAIVFSTRDARIVQVTRTHWVLELRTLDQLDNDSWRFETEWDEHGDAE